MIEPSELLRVTLGPVLVATVLAAIGRWRRWAWPMPLAAGAGFVAGYALILRSAAGGAAAWVPAWPPHDGTDWLFYAAAGAALLGVVAAIPKHAWLACVLGAIAAGGTAALIGWPLLEGGSVTTRALVTISLALAVAGAGLCAAASYAETRISSTAVVAGLCVTLAAGAVMVMSSETRQLGVYGIAAASALGTVAVLVAPRSEKAARAVAVVAVAILAGLLTACRLYAPTGVKELHFAVLMGAPVLMLIGAVLPARKMWVRGVVAVLVVATAVGVVTVPTALAAKKAAESTSDDPYGAYYP